MKYWVEGDELVMAEYINPKAREYRLQKKTNFIEVMKEIKQQIVAMKKVGIVPASQFEKNKEKR